MTQTDYTSRMAALLAQGGTDLVALVPGANMVYFTGLHFHLSERPIIALVHRDGLSFIMPELEMPKLEQRPDLNAQAFIWRDADGFAGTFQQAAGALSLDRARLGVDGMTMRIFEWLALRQAGVSAVEPMDLGRTLLLLRARKTADEVETMRRACQISEAALARTMARVQPGMKENEIAAMLEIEMRAGGSDGLSFAPLVLTGPKSALPHGSTGDRALGEDEFLLIDFGAMAGDYPADITRTFCPGGRPTEQMRAIYDAVLRANAAARAAAGPGVTCGEVDRAARDVITAAGYGEYFIHRTGHGLGLEVHELPNIAAGDKTVLEPGMVFTIEPGIYIPGMGGVRIEDNVVVTESGLDVLTSYPREL